LVKAMAVDPPRRGGARSVIARTAIRLRALGRSADFWPAARRAHCLSMSTPRNTELRVVPAAGEDDGDRATLRIDADRPVPAPPVSADDTRAHRQAMAERELDRLNQAATAEQLAVGQHMNWLIASQAILIHAFLMLFIVSSLGAVTINYWLLGGLALVGILCALALHANIDRASRALALLVVQRRAAEAELAALSGRTPNLPKEVSTISPWTGPLFVVAWLVLLACSAAIRL
jgi:hypothetical protein